MTKYDFRQVFLPYCLDRQPDGRYAVLNRHYKPVGMAVPSTRFVTYADQPCLVNLPGLTAQRAAQLATRGDGGLQRMYLYDDSCVPTDSDEAWSAYSRRLDALARLAVEF